MIFKQRLLFILLFLFSIPLKAQQVSANRLEAGLKKYSSVSPFKNKAGTDTLLVKFSRPLTPAEIEKLKPLRSFSGSHFIVAEKNMAGTEAMTSYQNKANVLWKASDKLIRIWEQQPGQSRIFPMKVVFQPEENRVPKVLQSLKITRTDLENHLLIVEIQLKNLPDLLQFPQVLFADIIQQAKEEVVINGADLSTNEIAALQQRYPDINGTGITLSLKEGLFDKDDIDLAGNLTTLPPLTAAVSTHATIMATLALGRGNSFIRGLGAAPSALLTTSDFKNLMPDNISQLNALKVNVQNHSYGTDIDNLYGAEALAYDKQVYQADTIFHVFSAGNIGTSTPTTGLYAGLVNTANLTGNFKQAKNVLVTGGISRDNIPETLSSKGPAYDGRVKPEIVALGQDGTSGAAAMTSGVVALLQQQYKNLYGKQPGTAILKSVLLNSADDLGTPQVDYATGFGKLNALQAIQTIRDKNFSTGTLGDQEDFTFPLQIQTAQQEIKVTLAWNDPPAAINSVQSIVNHLDLSMESPSGTVILPWVLSSYPSLDSLARPAVRKRDDINTVQQLSLQNVTPGLYTIHVKARKISTDKQTFAIAYQTRSADTFAWTFPVRDAVVFANEENYFRWNSSFNGQHGKLSISTDNGLNWQLLNDNTDLQRKLWKWTAPDLFTNALLKMEINGKTFITEPFVISRPIALQIGYNCTNQLLFHWKAQPGASGYTLYNLKDNTLVPVKQVTDTIAAIDKTAIASPWFSLSANGNGFNGMKGYTIDYTLQGVSCYVRTFTGSIDQETVKLDLNIASSYQLRRIIWEKQLSPGVFSVLAETAINPAQLNYTATDPHPRVGIQYYRATLETSTGQKSQTEIVPVNYLKQADFVIYPNPAADYLSVLSGDFEPYKLDIYNLTGQKVFQDNASGANQFNISSLSTGIYIVLISRNGTTLKSIKLIKK